MYAAFRKSLHDVFCVTEVIELFHGNLHQKMSLKFDFNTLIMLSLKQSGFHNDRWNSMACIWPRWLLYVKPVRLFGRKVTQSGWHRDIWSSRPREPRKLNSLSLQESSSVLCYEFMSVEVLSKWRMVQWRHLRRLHFIEKLSSAEKTFIVADSVYGVATSANFVSSRV